MAGPLPGRSDMPLPPRSPTTAPQRTRSRSRAAAVQSGASSALPPQPHRLRVLLQRLEVPRCRPFQLGSRLARHLVEHPAPHPFAHGLELRLLFRVEQRLDLLVEGDTDLPQLLDLLRSTERRVLLQRLQLLQLVVQDGDDLLLLR